MSSQREMQQTLLSLGIDPREVEWQDLGSCTKLDRSLITAEKDIFYDKYEKGGNIAKQTDQICLHCPVIAECYEYGTRNELTGVFGGFWLTKGEVDPIRNAHKSLGVVNELSERIFNEL